MLTSRRAMIFGEQAKRRSLPESLRDIDNKVSWRTRGFSRGARIAARRYRESPVNARTKLFARRKRSNGESEAAIARTFDSDQRRPILPRSGDRRPQWDDLTKRAQDR